MGRVRNANKGSTEPSFFTLKDGTTHFPLNLFKIFKKLTFRRAVFHKILSFHGTSIENRTIVKVQYLDQHEESTKDFARTLFSTKKSTLCGPNSLEDCIYTWLVKHANAEELSSFFLMFIFEDYQKFHYT